MIKIESYKNRVTGIYNGGDKVNLEKFIEDYINGYLQGNLQINSIWVEVKEKENSIVMEVWCYDNQIDSVLFGIKDKGDVNEITNLLQCIKDYLNENINMDYFN